MTADLPRRGEIRWALVPHVAEVPLRITGAPERLDFAAASKLIRARGPRAGAGVTLPAIVRPVLVLHGWESASHGSFAVLRTRRLESLSPATREAVRADASGGLILLDGKAAGHERVAMVAGIARVHGSVIDEAVVGHASATTMARVGERVAERLELDLDRIVGERVEAVLAGLGLA